MANAPDTLAIGLTISIPSDTGRVVANYLSTNPAASAILRKMWESKGLEPLMAAAHDGVRIAIPTPTAETRGMLAFLILGVLGHAIYV